MQYAFPATGMTYRVLQAIRISLQSFTHPNFPQKMNYRRICLSIVLCTGWLGAAFAEDLRPLVRTAVEKCQPSYLTAIKLSPGEIAFALDGAMRTVINQHEQALERIASANRMEKAIRGEVGSTTSKEEATVLRPINLKLLQDALTWRNACWDLFNSIHGRTEDYDALMGSLPGAAISPFLIDEIAKKGGALNHRIIVKNTGLVLVKKKWTEVPYEVSNQSVFFAAMSRVVALRSKDNKNLRIEYAKHLIARVGVQSALNERARIDYLESATLLTLAAQAGDDAVLDLLLRSGANPKIPMQRRDMSNAVVEKLPIDLYSGSDSTIVNRLAGASLPFTAPEPANVNVWNIGINGTTPVTTQR